MLTAFCRLRLYNTLTLPLSTVPSSLRQMATNADYRVSIQKALMTANVLSLLTASFFLIRPLCALSIHFRAMQRISSERVSLAPDVLPTPAWQTPVPRWLTWPSRKSTSPACAWSTCLAPKAKDRPLPWLNQCFGLVVRVRVSSGLFTFQAPFCFDPFPPYIIVHRI